MGGFRGGGGVVGLQMKMGKGRVFFWATRLPFGAEGNVSFERN